MSSDSHHEENIQSNPIINSSSSSLEEHHHQDVLLQSPFYQYPPSSTSIITGAVQNHDHDHDPSMKSSSNDGEEEVEEEEEEESENLVKLFIGQIPRNLDEDSLRPFFEEFGPIVDFSVIRDKSTKHHKGCAFVTYANQQSAINAIQSLHDKVKLPHAQNPLQIRPAENLIEKENKIFVGMLPKNLTEVDLHEMFGRYGHLKEVHIIRGPDGNSKGCAFVKYVDRESVLLAIQELNDTIPDGSTRPLVIKLADSKKISRDSFDETSGTLSGADVRDFWMAQHSASNSNFPSSDIASNPSSSSPGQYPMPLSPMMTHSQMMTQNPGISIPYLSYAHSSTGAPSPHMQPVAPSYMFYHGFYSHDGANTPNSPSSNMSVIPMSPNGQLLYQLPTAAMSPPNSRTFYQMTDHRQVPNAYPGSRPAPAPASHQNHASSTTSPTLAVPSDKPDAVNRQVEGPVGANLFIYHLPRDLTDADLATLFAPFGEVLSAKVFMDKKTAESKGFGFVSFGSVPAAEAAISSMNGFQIGSKRLKVQHKRVGGFPETTPMNYPSSPARGSPGSRNDNMSGYPTGIPINVAPYYQQNPYLAMNPPPPDSMYSQHTLGMAHSPPVGMAFLQSPYGSPPMPAQYINYTDESQRRMAAAAAAAAYPPMYMNQSPPSSRPYHGHGHGQGHGQGQGQGYGHGHGYAPRSGSHDSSGEVYLSQSFDQTLRLNPESGS